jgi:hypothetical protein
MYPPPILFISPIFVPISKVRHFSFHFAGIIFPFCVSRSVLLLLGSLGPFSTGNEGVFQINLTKPIGSARFFRKIVVLIAR